MKFEIFAGAVEKTNPTTDVKSITAKEVACVAGGEIAITIDELATTGNTVLRYDSTSWFLHHRIGRRLSPLISATS